MSIADIEGQCQTLVGCIKKWDNDDLAESDFVQGARTIASVAFAIIDTSEEYAEERTENELITELIEVAHELRDHAAIFIKSKKEVFTHHDGELTKEFYAKTRGELLVALKLVYQTCRKITAMEDKNEEKQGQMSQEERERYDRNRQEEQERVKRERMEQQRLAEIAQREAERKAREEERQADIGRQEQQVVKIVSQAKKFLLELNELQNVVVGQDTAMFKIVIRKVVYEVDILREYCEEVTSYAGWDDIRETTLKNINLAAVALKKQDETIKESFLEQKERLAEKIVQIVSKIRTVLQARIVEIEQESLDDQEDAEEESHEPVEVPSHQGSQVEQHYPEQDTEQHPEQHPPEQHPSEQHPSEQHPSEQHPSEQHPSEQHPSEQHPSEQHPSEQHPSEQHQPEQHPPEQHLQQQNQKEQHQPEQHQSEQHQPEQSPPESSHSSTPINRSISSIPEEEQDIKEKPSKPDVTMEPTVQCKPEMSHKTEDGQQKAGSELTQEGGKSPDQTVQLSWNTAGEETEGRGSQNKNDQLLSLSINTPTRPRGMFSARPPIPIRGISQPVLKKESIDLSLVNLAQISHTDDTDDLPGLRRRVEVPPEPSAGREDPLAGLDSVLTASKAMSFLNSDVVEKARGKGKRNTGKRLPKGVSNLKSSDSPNLTELSPPPDVLPPPLPNDTHELGKSSTEKILEIFFGKFSHWKEDWDRLEETERNALIKSVTSVISEESVKDKNWMIPNSIHKLSTTTPTKPQVNTQRQTTIMSLGPQPPSNAGGSLRKPDLRQSGLLPTAVTPSTSQDLELGTDAMYELQRLMEMSSGDLNQGKKRLGGDNPGKFSLRAKKVDRNKRPIDRRVSSMMVMDIGSTPTIYPVRRIQEASLGFISTTYQMIGAFENLFRQRDLNNKPVDPSSQKEGQTISKDLSSSSIHIKTGTIRDSKLNASTTYSEDKISLLRSIVKEQSRKVFSVFMDTLVIIQDESPDTPPENVHGPIAGVLLKQMEDFNSCVETETDLLLPIDSELIKVGRWLHVVQQSLLIGIYQAANSFYFTTSQILTNWNHLPVNPSASHCCTLHVLALINSIIKILKALLNNSETLFNLIEVANQKEHSSPKEEKIEEKKEDKKENKHSLMWDPQKEKEAEEQLSQIDSPGDLDNLVLRLTPNFPHTPNHDYTLAFLTTCQRFCTPTDLLDRLFDRFYLPTKAKKASKVGPVSTKADDDNYNMARVRVVNIILKWLKSNSHYVDDVISDKIRQFIEKSLRKEKIFEGQIKSLDAELNNTSQYELPPSLARKAPDKIMCFVAEMYAPFDTVLQVDELQIAQQLTLIEFEIYSRIKETELLGQVWSKEKKQSIAQNVVQLIQRANRTSFWVATCIMLQSKVKDRIKVLTRFMNIAKHLRDLNNYNTLMGIIAGLNTVSVSRLKHSFTGIKRGVTEQWDLLMELMNPSNAFKRLRTAMDESGPSALPYIGMYLSDLTFLEDGNPDEVIREEGPNQIHQINFAKHFMIYRSIDQLRKYQTSAKFALQRQDPVFTFLFELPTLSEEDLYQLSLTREPRECTAAMIK